MLLWLTDIGWEVNSIVELQSEFSDEEDSIVLRKDKGLDSSINGTSSL